MAEEHVRRDLLVKTVLEILRDAGTKVPPSQVLDELRRRVELTPYELSVDNSGLQRYNRATGFHTLEAATIGWMSKIGGWSITDAGIEALETYPDASGSVGGTAAPLPRGRSAAQAGAAKPERSTAVHRHHAAVGGPWLVDRPR